MKNGALEQKVKILERINEEYEAKLEKYKKTSEYQEAKKEIEKKPNLKDIRGIHFNHITSSLLFYLTKAVESMEMGSTWKEVEKDYQKALVRLKSYLYWIEKFPEFRKGELTKEGYCKNIESSLTDKLREKGITCGAMYYVDEATKELEKKL